MTVKYNLNPDGSFMNAEQIVEDILANRLDDEMRRIIGLNFDPPLSDEEKEQVAETGFNPYSWAYSSFGRWIRNSYGLWAENNPHTTLKWDQNSEVRDGVDYHPNHPDNYSVTVMDELVRRLAPPKKCAGCSLQGPDHQPTFYATPTDGVCANLQKDGPTPCWYPHCVDSVETVSVEGPSRRLPYDWNNGVIKRWSIFRRVAHWFRTGQWL